MYKISDTLTEAKGNWKVELAAGGQSLAEVKIRKVIFQGDSLSP